MPFVYPHKQHMYIIVYAFDTQRQLTTDFYITPDFSNIFYLFSYHLQRSVCGYIKEQSQKVCGFRVYLYTIYSNDQSSVSYWFCTGKSRDCRFQNFSNIPQRKGILGLEGRGVVAACVGNPRHTEISPFICC